MTEPTIPAQPGGPGSAPTPTGGIEAAAAFAAMLVSRETFFDHMVQRPQGLLRVRGCDGAVAVPDIMVSAARAVVVKGPQVVELSEAA